MSATLISMRNSRKTISLAEFFKDEKTVQSIGTQKKQAKGASVKMKSGEELKNAAFNEEKEPGPEDLIKIILGPSRNERSSSLPKPKPQQSGRKNIINSLTPYAALLEEELEELMRDLNMVITNHKKFESFEGDEVTFLQNLRESKFT